MRIGIDASCWVNRRGYGRYTRGIVRALIAHQEHRFVLFADHATAAVIGHLPPQASLAVVRARIPAAEAASASGHRSWRDLWAMSRAVRTLGADCDLFYFPSVYTFYPLPRRLPAVVTIHDTIPERHPHLVFPSRHLRVLWRIKVRWALAQAAVVTTVSDAARLDLITYFRLSGARVRVVPDAVDSVFNPATDPRPARAARHRLNIAEHERIILYVGGISPHKNLATLLDAFALLTREPDMHDLRLVLAGDIDHDPFYSNYRQLRQQVEVCGLADRVIFTGFLSDDNLADCYRSADVVVLPSLAEGFGLPALEAMACGTPVAASSIPALREVAGDAAAYFNPADPSDLAAQVASVLRDAARRAELRRRGLARARRYTWETSARTLLMIFDTVAARHV